MLGIVLKGVRDIISGPAKYAQNSKHISWLNPESILVGRVAILIAFKDSGYWRDVPPRTRKLGGTFPI